MTKVDGTTLYHNALETIRVLRAERDALREALMEAEAHLDYCGWGDSWERECATASKLPEKIAAALSFAAAQDANTDASSGTT